MPAEGMGLLDVLTKSGMTSSNTEARKMVAQGGVKINQQKIDDPKMRITEKKEFVVQVGKRAFKKIVLSFFVLLALPFWSVSSSACFRDLVALSAAVVDAEVTDVQTVPHSKTKTECEILQDVIVTLKVTHIEKGRLDNSITVQATQRTCLKECSWCVESGLYKKGESKKFYLKKKDGAYRFTDEFPQPRCGS